MSSEHSGQLALSSSIHLVQGGISGMSENESSYGDESGKAFITDRGVPGVEHRLLQPYTS